MKTPTVKLAKSPNGSVHSATSIMRCVALSILSHSAFAETEISLSHLSGDAKGYLQTPAGGGAGTTAPERPTLKELGIDSLSIYDFSVGRHVGKGKHKLLGGYQLIRAESTETLSRGLTSQNQNFPAGIAYHRIDYEDRQLVPNHIRIEAGPLFKVGLNIRI